MWPSGSPPLKVTIISARGLRNADWLPGTGKSDPYCTCEVQGKLALQKIKTKVINDNLNPAWDHEGEIQGYSVGDDLVFNVFDHDFAGSDGLLGTVTVHSRDFVPGGFEGELSLAGEKGGSAFLSIRIPPWQSGDAEVGRVSSLGDQFEECIEGEKSQQVQRSRMSTSQAMAGEDFAVDLEQPYVDPEAAMPKLPSAPGGPASVVSAPLGPPPAAPVLPPAAAVTSEVERLQAKVLELTTEVEQLHKAKQEELQKQQRAADRRHADLAMALETSTQEATGHRDRVQQLQHQHDQASAEAAQRINSLAEDLRRGQQHAFQEAEQLRADAAAAAGRVRCLEAQLEGLGSNNVEMERLKQEAAAAAEHIATLTAEVDVLHKARADTDVADVAAKLREANENMEELWRANLEEVEPLQKDVEMLTKRVEQLQLENQELHSQLENTSKGAAALAVDVERQKQSCAEAEQKVSSLNGEVARLTSELKEKSQNLDEAMAVATAASARRLELKNELDGVKAELQEQVGEAAAHERAEATSLLAIAEARIKELQDHGSNAAAEAEKRVHELAKELEQTRGVTEANGRVEELSKEVEHLRAAHAQAEALVKKLSADASAQASNDGSVDDATTFKLRAEIVERDGMIRQMARSMEARDAAAGAQAAELKAQIDALVQSSRLGEEALRSNSAALQKEQQRSMRLQAELQEARASHARAAQQAAKLHKSEVELVQLQQSASGDKAEGSAGSRPSTVPEAAALAIFGDLELGRAGSTLSDLGLDGVQGLQQIDRTLQGFSVLLAWRSDIRLTFFGIWILCHSLYMFYLFLPRLF